MRNVLASVVASLLLGGVGTSAARAGIDFSSTFDGTAPWNWDSSTGSGVSGTNSFTAQAGPTAGANYLTKAVTSDGAGDGTGILRITMDVDLSNMDFAGFYNGPNIAAVGTAVGNKGPTGKGSISNISVGNWKAGTGDPLQLRFSVSSAIQYHGGSTGTTSQVFTPSAGQTPIYNLVWTLDASRSDDVWTLNNTLEVTGPSSGNIVTASTSGKFTDTNANFHGLNDVSNYLLGTLNTGNTVDGTSITFDNFNAAVPEPASLGLLAVGGLALLRRRK